MKFWKKKKQDEIYLTGGMSGMLLVRDYADKVLEDLEKYPTRDDAIQAIREHINEMIAEILEHLVEEDEWWK